MNGWDILILIAVAAMVFFAVRAWRRGGRRSGSCCDGCSGCAAGKPGGRPCCGKPGEKPDAFPK